MPFTFSHPALVIPLLRLHRKHPWLSATGLIAGSIAPDFEKFFRLKLASQHSHTVASVFYFSCPVALFLAFVFHLVVRRPLLAHLPAVLYRRLGKYASFKWLVYFREHYVGVVLSSIVGAALHLFWDSFTHRDTMVANLLPILDETVWVGWTVLPVHEVVSLVSSVLGGLFIGWSVWKMPIGPPRPVPPPTAVGRYWGMIALVTAALAGEWILAVKPRLLSAGIATISATLLGVLAVSAYTSYRDFAHGRPS